jgi:hypothetical protein
VQQDHRLTFTTFDVVEANTSHFDEFPSGRVVTLGLFGNEAVDNGGDRECRNGDHSAHRDWMLGDSVS